MDNKNKSNVGLDVDNNVDEVCKFNVSGWGTRYTQCVVLFIALTVAHSMRSCMGVALVAMVRDATRLKDVTHNYIIISNNSGINNNESDISNITSIIEGEDFEIKGIFNALLLTPPYPIFYWSKKTQDTIMASFFWGYMSLQIPSGQLAHRFGARRLLAGALLLNSLFSFIMPVAVYYGGWVCGVICRVSQGMAQACFVPGIHTVLGKWAPVKDRGRMTAIIYGGQAIGTVLGLPTTGFIASSSLGWPGIFRFYSLLSCIVGVSIWFLLADSPSQHKCISITERRYIEEALGQTHGKLKMPVPWGSIFRCRGMWAIIVAHIGQCWGQTMLFSELPSFMDKIMGFNIKANGLLTALPFLVMWFTNFFFSWLTDILIVKKYLSVTMTRKLANSLGYFPPSIGLIVLGYAPNNIYIVESILVIICGFKVAGSVGFQVNHVDIAPNFAGTMMSISNFVANAVGSLAPIVAGIILTDATDKSLWRQVFFISAGLYFTTNLVYVVFGTGELAEWNDPQYEKVPLEDKNCKVLLEDKNCKDKNKQNT